MGIWNAHEAIPLMILSARTVNKLPALDEQCFWLPVDYCAFIVEELARLNTESQSAFDAKAKAWITEPDAIDTDKNLQVTWPELGARFYNVIPKESFHWTNDFLPHLKEKIDFEIVPVKTWLQAIRDSNREPRTGLMELTNVDDVVDNPSLKLLEFWEKKYKGEDTADRSHKLKFSTVKAMQQSSWLRSMPKCFDDGELFVTFVENWKKAWEEGENFAPSIFSSSEPDSDERSVPTHLF